ncbi:MAG: CPBP family intramembrane metalloprotease [Chloroflexi bacterium]|nr:CPBP family intramembrane metalloprotease [Chloroflexota bacterium]
MTAHSAQPVPSNPARVLWETLLVLLVSLGLGLIDPGLKTFSILLPVAYLIIERRLRKRPWRELGFDLKGFPAAVKANWWLVVLVVFVMQVLAVFGTRAFLPEFITHVVERLPISIHNGWMILIPSLLLTTLGEEIVYRGFFQERLTWFIKAPLAIGIISVVFALMHYSPGPLGVVAVDLGLIVIDSILYGTIFARGKNIFVSWMAHALADIVGVGLLLL